jgi:hypothetical protein
MTPLGAMLGCNYDSFVAVAEAFTGAFCTRRPRMGVRAVLWL